MVETTLIKLAVTGGFPIKKKSTLSKPRSNYNKKMFLILQAESSLDQSQTTPEEILIYIYIYYA